MKSKIFGGMGVALVALALTMPAQGQTRDGDLSVGRMQSGELIIGDRSDRDKRLYDSWTLRGEEGQRLSVLLESTAFDTQLQAPMADGTILSNDDNHWAGETTDSRLDLVIPASGSLAVHARSFRPGGSGDYTIRVVPTDSLQTSAIQASPAESIAIGRSVTGELASAEPTIQAGRRADHYSFNGTAGQRVDLRAVSTDFDTILTLTGADSFSVRNDDDATAGGETLNSRLLATLPADGIYDIAVSSYGRGVTGAYELTTRINGSGASDTAAATVSGASLAFGQVMTDILGKGNETLDSGEYTRSYSFEGRRGQPVTIDYSSDDYDTYLIVRSPSGEQADIDDTGEGNLNSRFEQVLEEDGVYAVTATSYAPGATGNFRLALSEGTTRIPATPERRQVFAISVGVADYGGNANDLDYTDTDAAKIYEKLAELGVLRQESILLTNQEATLDEFRAAFQRVAAQAGPDDMFLLFFSGHGVQHEDADDAAELDGRDEYLVFGDGEELSDDDLAAMFATVNAGTTMVVLDACFSGGFERDLITRPNMMGLFSSEEDLTSLVASEFSAGGYLSRFFADGLAGQADDNGDRNVTAGELVSYLRYRFRDQCDGRNCIEAETGDAQRNHQELVVQRGSVEVDDILVTLPEQFGVMRGGAR